MKRITLVIAAFGLAAAAACGSETPAPSGDPGPPPTATETTDHSTLPTVPPTIAEGPHEATSLEEARAGVVRIVGTGTFADPGGGMQSNVPGSGSGFVIDPSGIAVTNNHVVTGAGLLDVYVEGEDRPRNARVLGVSECSDLAVIQIEGDEFPVYLGWHDGAVPTGMDVYAAGFPLGDAEYTVLDGIVSKERAAGETQWASVDSVIEHTANTLPGNSGGPLVTADGKVVGITYAGNTAGQEFAISVEIARPVVEMLADGVDVNSIGINGEAFSVDGFSGIWVYSVQSGSPADQALIQAGDLLLSMEAIMLATDGTMADYCDILRSHEGTDTLAIEVYRPTTNEILEGQLNGRPLTVQWFPDPGPDTGSDDGADYAEYVTVTDDSGVIVASVPAEWAEIAGGSWTSDIVTGTVEPIGPALTATVDLETFLELWSTSGVFIGASTLIDLGVDGMLDRITFEGECTYEGRFDYDTGSYIGAADVFTDCGPKGSVVFHLVVQPPDGSWIAAMLFIATSEEDVSAIDHVLDTVTITGLV